jgi:hypothetical protein
MMERDLPLFNRSEQNLEYTRDSKQQIFIVWKQSSSTAQWKDSAYSKHKQLHEPETELNTSVLTEFKFPTTGWLLHKG